MSDSELKPIMADTATPNTYVFSRKQWVYDPSVDAKRDLRLDFLRGLAIASMVINHLESRSYFNNITQGHIYASSAEGFVFLSGMVLGLVTRQRIQKIGLPEAMKKLLERAWTLYKTSFILMATLGLLSIFFPGWTRPAFEAAPGSWWQILLAAATLHLAPPVIDILQLYVLCLVASPGMFWLLRRGLWAPLLAISWSVWSLQQLHPYALSFHPLDRDHPYFSFASWQILYVHGLAAGYYRSQLQQLWARIPKLPLVTVLVTIVIAAMVAAQYDMQLGVWPANVSQRVQWLQWTDRSINGPIRLVTLLGLFPLLYMVVNTFWLPLNKALGKLLIPLGQNSLYVYVMHVPLTVLWFMVPGLTTGDALVTTLLQAIAIGFFWFLIKKQFLFNVVPR
ncbi:MULTISPECIES: OpgC domain-containing protein [Trichocoleus]|uniref:OpgC domain-containing protein n=1 Tax=Trichocoleus desertorum GB2-A4 TaxID=2933944 RepID=A0ABV0J2W9_9CYAN|nr:OpgC domain-containing protein [Trichocoleus sp. FACHB-46]MBD1860737.1 OpgC domain-containing protein [Trichocoleus sp. FACHB-46]